MRAITLLWIGCIAIFLSVILQIIALVFLLLPFAVIGLILNAASVPLTIWQGYRSAVEQQQQIEQERKEREFQDYLNSPQGQLDIVFDRVGASMGIPKRTRAKP